MAITRLLHRCRTLTVLALLASADLSAQLAPSGDDLWDVSNGNAVTANSEALNSANPADMFGAVTNGAPEPGNMLFTDSQSAGYVHWVEWQTAQADKVRSALLFAAHDGPPFDANHRGISKFTLYAKSPGANQFDTLLAEYEPASPYADGPQPDDGLAQFNQGGNEMRLCVNFPTVTAGEFRAEFEQFGDSSANQRGPRIFELDGHASRDCGLFQINQGMSDAWFNADTPGQGFFIVVLPDAGIVFLAWFTYDTELPPEEVVALLGAAEHRWVTAQGPYAGDTAELTVFLTSGGVFDAAEPPAVTDVDDPLGTITIVWHDCENATLTYDIDPPGVSGEMAIRRIVPDNAALCEALMEP